MGISDQQSMIPKYGGVISNCDPANNKITVTTAGGAVDILVPYVPAFWRWPVVGEKWLIRKENGSWTLDSLARDPNSDAPLAGMQPGEAQINATTTIDASGNQFVTVNTSTFSDGYTLKWVATSSSFVGVPKVFDSGWIPFNAILSGGWT